MGRVYRALDLRLSRDVALKLHGFAIRAPVITGSVVDASGGSFIG